MVSTLKFQQISMEIVSKGQGTAVLMSLALELSKGNKWPSPDSLLLALPLTSFFLMSPVSLK